MNGGVADVVVSAVIKSSGFTIIVFRSNSGRTAYLQLYVESTRLRVFDESFNQIGSTYNGYTQTVGDVLQVTANGTAISVQVNGTTVISGTSSTYLTQTYHGLRGGAGSEIFDDFNLAAFVPPVPTATLMKATPTAVYLTSTDGGGTSPQWSRSTSPASGFSNLSNGSGISGATSGSLVDGSSGIAVGTRYYYKVTYATSGASNVQSGGAWKRPAYVLFIGDSVTLGFGTSAPSTGGTNVGTTSPVYHFSKAVKNAANGQRDVIVYDASEGGLKASDWYDAAGSGAAARMTAASANGISAGCTHAVVTLGINDAYSAETTAQYQANLAGIAGYLLGQGHTAVVLNYPTGIPELGDGALTKLLTLTANIDALINGTTILLGDTLMLTYLQDHRDTELQTSGTAVHPNETGTRSVGEAWAWGWSRAVGDVPATGGSGPVPMIGSPMIRRAS